MLQRMKKLKLNDVISDPLTSGIFHYIYTLTPSIPWAEDIEASTLDLEYMGNISGQKNVSPLIKNILLKDSTTNILTTADMQTLATTIYKMFYDSWVKEYNTLSLEYNPISNYDMTESETASGTTGNTRLNTGTQATAKTGTITTTHTGTQGTSESNQASGTTTGSADRGLYGFNSSESVGDSTDSTSTTTGTSASGSSTRTDNLSDTQTNNTTDTTTDNLSQSDSGTHSDTRTLTRSGNIGVTTSQQMLTAEREVGLWNFFYTVLFPSLDKVLTICNYS